MESYYESYNDKHTYPKAWIQEKENMPPHFHNALEFVGVAGGCLDVMVDGKGMTLMAGQIMIAGSMSTHSLYSKYPGKYYCVQLPRDLATEWNSLLTDKTFSNIFINDEHGILELMDIAVRLSDSGLFEKKSEMCATELRLIISALTGIIIRCSDLVPKQQMTDLVARAVELINLRFHEKIRLSDISKELLCSSQVLSEQFRKVMGMSIAVYTNLLRVSEFKQLSDCGKMNIEQAAAEAGFQSIRTAYRYFKTVYGISPRSK